MDFLLPVFDSKGLYRKAMSVAESFCPKNENGYAFTEDMIDDLVNAFKSQTFTKGSAILRKKFIAEDIIIQFIPVKEKAGKL